MKFGRFDVTAPDFGPFRLDGGSMFGSVPKNLWASRIAPDADNCIPLATRSLLIRADSTVILVDVGCGDKWDEKYRKIYGIRNAPESALGFERKEVTDIILTHLHFDHAGGISRYKEGSKVIELVYPNATVHLQRDNWINAQTPNLKERASYLPEHVQPLKDARLNLLQGDTELFPDIFVRQVNGHTRGQQWIELRAGTEGIAFPTDLIPTSHHVPLAFHMGYDICAETLLREKETFLDKAAEHKMILIFQHDLQVPAARIVKDEKCRYSPSPASISL